LEISLLAEYYLLPCRSLIFRIFKDMQYLLSNGLPLRVRQARPEDAVSLLEMFRKVVAESDFLLTTLLEARMLTVEQEKEFIASYQQNPRNLFMVAEVNDTLAGSMSVTLSKWKKQSHVGEFGIVILREYWNLGIGRRMINTMLQWSKEHPSIRLIQLSVLANNDKAIRMYKNFGFKEQGRLEKAICQPDKTLQDLLSIAKWDKDGD